MPSLSSRPRNLLVNKYNQQHTKPPLLQSVTSLPPNLCVGLSTPRFFGLTPLKPFLVGTPLYSFQLQRIFDPPLSAKNTTKHSRSRLHRFHTDETVLSSFEV
ncbi:hypothetical protein XPA_000864 [Xanthoria parietina]